MKDPEIRMEGVSKVFETPAGEGLTAVSDFDLEVGDNEFVSLLGPSGCGKSTILNIIAGFIEPTEGSVTFLEEPVEEPSSERAVVFQETESLFEWKTCLENVKFGPLAIGSEEEASERRALELLEMVGLRGFEKHYPDQLSGGMQQRLNLARALANNPRTLLMDEPFGALDAQTKTILQEALMRIWSDSGQTILFITHDVEEAIYLSERVLVMTAAPGSLKSTYEVGFEYPRDFELRESREFVELKNRVLDDLYEESVAASRQILERA